MDAEMMMAIRRARTQHRSAYHEGWQADQKARQERAARNQAMHVRGAVTQ